ncbi:hypothetical protein EDD15DRAFT_2488303 [Pisolithus albus]|nr:hypothetical protein EDD15DRAFT_2488303 [Pisolithus albus]
MRLWSTCREITPEPEHLIHFLFAEGNVKVDRNTDNTESLLRGPDQLPPGCGLHLLPADGSPKPARAGDGLTPNFSCIHPSAKQLQIHHRTHSHLVFKEVCQPIYDLRRLDIVFKTRMDVQKALELSHSIGWVHCDIDTGNVLRWGERMGKLADLEYAKRMDSNTTAHAVRTKYLFQDPIGDPVKCPFRFNPLHDMESLWWISTWALYYHVDQQGGWPSSGQITESYKLFPGRLKARLHAFLAPLDYEVLPASFQSAGRLVEYMRREIKRAYTASEEELPPVYSNPLKRLQSTFTNHLTSILADSMDIRTFNSNAKRQQEDPMPDIRDPKQPKWDGSREPSNAGHQ